MELDKYIQDNYPHIIAEHKRATTPFYYEAGVEYHPITNGFGCDSGGSDERFIIKDGTYLKNGDVQMTLESLDKKDHRCIVRLSEAHTKIARVDESVQPKGNPIPSNKRVKYMTVNGMNFTITQFSWRGYKDNKLCGRIWIHCDQYPKSRVWGEDKSSWYELYNYLGNGWNLKHVKSYDSVGREKYDIKFNVSMREFKRIIFGNQDIKIKCELFSDK